MHGGIGLPTALTLRSCRFLGSGTAFRGRRKAASYHCIDLLDVVGVMNYRDCADGADGLIAHGRDLLDYADRNGGARVIMGVETFQSPPTEVQFVFGPPRTAWLQWLEQSESPLIRASRINGLRLRTFDDGRSVHLGVEVPAETEPETRPLVATSLQELAALVAAMPGDESADPASDLTLRREHLRRTLARDSAWSNLVDQDIVDAQTGTTTHGFSATSHMLSKITFAGQSVAEVDTQLQAAEDYFARYRSYAGAAIHFYETYRALPAEQD